MIGALASSKVLRPSLHISCIASANPSGSGLQKSSHKNQPITFPVSRVNAIGDMPSLLHPSHKRSHEAAHVLNTQVACASYFTTRSFFAAERVLEALNRLLHVITVEEHVLDIVIIIYHQHVQLELNFLV